jgi:hypothetical protein
LTRGRCVTVAPSTSSRRWWAVVVSSAASAATTTAVFPAVAVIARGIAVDTTRAVVVSLAAVWSVIIARRATGAVASTAATAVIVASPTTTIVAATASAIVVAVSIARGSSTSTTELTLGRAIVLAGSGSTRSGTAGLLDAQCPALMNFTLEALLGGVSLVRGDHLHEAEAARFLCMRVTHDVALLYLAIFLEEARNLVLGEAGVDAGYEEVRAWVAAAVVVVTSRRRATAVATIGRCASGAGVI